jgi:predicted nucleic acid-binding protein
LVAISFVTIGELLFGAAKDSWNKAKVERLKARLRSVVIVPYDYAVCETYGRIKAALPKGRTIADNDLWIAACAVRHSVPLITHNRKHFDEIRGMIIISEQKIDSELRAQAGLDLKDVVPPGEPPPTSQSEPSS